MRYRSRIPNRIICPIFTLLLVLFFAGRGSTSETFQYRSFRELPGVTESEIIAIEALQNEMGFFVYGMPLSTEAFEDADGVIGGYSALLCEWLSEFFGIPFKPALYEWLDLLDGLESKEVAFSGELTSTEERLKIYHMTGAIASRPLKYYRIAGSAPLQEIVEERPIRCGFIEGTATIATVVAELEPGTFDVVELSDVSLVYDALKSREIDAFYYSGTAEANFVQYGDLAALDFYPLIYRPVSLATQDPALEPIISVVERVLAEGGLRYFITLYNQGERDYQKYKLHRRLDEEERAYIRNNPVVRIGIDPGNYPGSFYDAREREWRGFDLDILEEVSLLTGLTFERVNDENTPWPVIYNMLLDGEIAMVPELVQSMELRGLFLWPQTAVLTDNFALISKTNYRDIKINEVLFAKVGLARNTAYADIFRKWFPGHMNSVEYESMEEALGALLRDEVEMVMANEKRLLYLTHYLELPDYKANIVFDMPVDIKMGLHDDETILCSILAKTLTMIDSKGISDRWMRRTYDYRAKVIEAQRPWLAGASVLMLCVLTLLLIMFVTKRNEGRRLEELVKSRTSELQFLQRNLEAALLAAETASRSKSAFLANMSHEIRTPMNSIIGFSELALDDEIPQKTRDYLGKVRTNAEWLLQIIDDILDITEVESGKMEIEHVPFKLHDLFANCRALTLPKATEKGLMTHFYAEPSLGKEPLGDPARLRQVLINLLSNAIKFTKTGIIKLHSEVLETTENTVTMRFEVKDSGIGMTQEQIAHIFEPFSQAESGTTRKYGGTGLGLAITKSIVELMGGKLSVESAPGVGSNFTFTLTFDTIEVSSESVPEKKSAPDEIEKPNFEGEILLCEDNPMNQQVICEHLSRVGLRTVVAENGKIGVDMVRERMESGEKQFDLIFMDMHMPVMDGLDAAARIFELKAGVPIVAMTANIMTEDRETYRKSGMDDCVGKPFTSQELWHCLMKYFDPAPVSERRESEAPPAQPEDELRRKLITYFVSDNRNKYREITEAIGAGDIKTAHRLAHTLKGNAGYLGKTLLQKAAEKVEHSLKGGVNNAAPEQMDALKTELDAALAEFAPLSRDEPKSETTAPAEPFDADSAREILEKLEPLLEMGNPECRKFIDDLRRIPGSEELIQQMEDLDFEPAAATLAELRKNLDTV